MDINLEKCLENAEAYVAKGVNVEGKALEGGTILYTA